MLRFVVRRLLLLVPILLGLSILIFLWIRALPGSPAESLLGERATPEAVAAIRHQYGLDKPLPVQYWAYLKSLATLNFGNSVLDGRPVLEELKLKFPATVELAVSAMLFAVIIGIPLGFYAAKRHGTWFDQSSLVVSLLGVSTPIFFLAIILKWIFAVELGWLPSVGREDILSTAQHPTNFYILDGIITWNWAAVWDTIQHLILPAIALGSIPLAIVMRITRASVLDVQNEDYVRTARAKGLSSSVVSRRHIMRNAMLPVATVVGLQTGLLLSGAVLTETVFAFPGMGYWLFNAIQGRDFPVVEGGIAFVAIVVVFVNLIVDISYGFLNPRIRVS